MPGAVDADLDRLDAAVLRPGHAGDHHLARGVEAVEVGIDGTWHQAKLAAQDTIDTWRQWYYPWQATAGNHMLQVRATDKTGHTQTSVIHKPEPNGATGYHTIHVTVA